MPRPQRRRILRNSLAFLLLTGSVVVAAQLAGVTGSGTRNASRLVIDGTHESWLVQMPASKKSGARNELSGAARALGGGKAGSELPGGWYEVSLGSEIAAAEAEQAFGSAGAVDVEPVLPRLPYVEDEPQSAGDTPAPVVRAGAVDDEPTSHVDTPSNLGVSGTELRTGPLRATRLGEQWALTQASNIDINAPEAWQTTTGTGAIVAVIDTGVDASHPDLAGRVLPGRDFSGSTTGATVDKVGHGTQVASLIAANGTGMAGVAPDAQILPLKVFRDTETSFSMSGYLAAIRYAADQNADVINISLGCGASTSCYSQAELDALTYAADRGVLIVAAAGNGDRNGQGLNNDSPDTPDYPSGYDLPSILSVTASTRLGNWSTWANYGATSVDLAAPGEGILVAAPNGSYRAVPGTSFAAPIVAGTAALLAAANPASSPEDIRARILATVQKTATLRTRSVSGGILDAQAAVATTVIGGGALTATKTVAPVSPRSGARVGTPPVLSWTLPAGWKSREVIVSHGAKKYRVPVTSARRSISHPTAAWRSGAYRWQVVATSPAGRSVTTTARTYTINPRVNAWVTSGTVRDGGTRARLRVGYASSELAATTRVTLTVGGKVVHKGSGVRRTTHARGTGSPRRGWFVYDAPLRQVARVGQKVRITVTVTSGRTSVTRQFTARVS